MDSEEERLPDEKYVEELAKKLPQGTDKTPEVLEEALKGLPDKYGTLYSKSILLTMLINKLLIYHISLIADGRTTSFVVSLH